MGNLDDRNPDLIQEDLEQMLGRLEGELADQQRAFDRRIEELRALYGEGMAALEARIVTAEAERPLNAYERKVDDGHHHMQTIEALDSGVLRGFGFQVDFRNGLTATRNGRRITVDAAGGVGFCYDYHVDVDYIGTEGAVVAISESTHTFKRFSTIQGAIDDAVADGQSGKTYSLGICPGTYRENIIWPSSPDQITGIFMHGFDFISHDNFGEVYIAPITGDVIQVTGNPKLIAAENIVFGTPISGDSINHISGINWAGQFTHCEFRGSITGADFTDMHFAHCKFDSDVSPGDIHDVYFHDCKFSNILDLKTNVGGGGGADNVTVNQCVFLGANARILLGQGATNILIEANQFTTSGATANSRVELTPDTGDPLHHVTIRGNAFTTGPLVGGQEILLDTSASSSNIWSVVIEGNTFSDVHAASGLDDTCHVRLKGNSAGDIFGIVFANNVMGATNAQTGHIELGGGFTVIGDYVEESVFGPSGRHNVVKYKITNGVNNLFIPESSDETGSPGSGATALTPFVIYIPMGSDRVGQLHAPV